MPKIIKLKSISDALSTYDFLAKKEDFIQITEWANGEGHDITINDHTFGLTHGQLEAINYLIRALDYDKE